MSRRKIVGEVSGLLDLQRPAIAAVAVARIRDTRGTRSLPSLLLQSAAVPLGGIGETARPIEFLLDADHPERPARVLDHRLRCVRNRSLRHAELLELLHSGGNRRLDGVAV